MFGFFRKNKIKDDENIRFIKGLDRKKISYVTKRTPSGETVLAKDGYMNVTGEEFIIMCGNKIVVRESLGILKAGELLSRDGVVIEAFKDSGKDTYVAYYKYYRE